MVTAARRAGAAQISVVIPYFGYARCERKFSSNGAHCVSAADVSQILEFAGVDRILTLDIHAPAVVGTTSNKCVFEDTPAGFVSMDYF